MTKLLKLESIYPHGMPKEKHGVSQECPFRGAQLGMKNIILMLKQT